MKPLTDLFAGMLRKQGYSVVAHECLDLVDFENYAIQGTILFNKDNKTHKIRWRCKHGYALYDVPFEFPNHYISAEFTKANKLLEFLQRRVIWKKKK